MMKPSSPNRDVKMDLTSEVHEPSSSCSARVMFWKFGLLLLRRVVTVLVQLSVWCTMSSSPRYCNIPEVLIRLPSASNFSRR